MTLLINILLWLCSHCSICSWLFSHSPIFAFSDDNNFGPCDGKSNNMRLRISLINLMFGDVITYIGTYEIETKKIKLFYQLRLSEFDFSVNYTSVTRNTYLEHLNSLNPEEIVIERESLNEHIQYEQSRIETSNQKINSYMTIILTVLPIILGVLDVNKILKASCGIKICMLIILYGVVNICAYLINTIKVRAIHRGMFKDLKESEEKDKELNLQYYFNWQHLKKQANMFVSYVINIQEWIYFVLVFSLLTCLMFGLGNDKEPYKNGKGDIYNISIKEMEETYSQSAIEWSDMIFKLQNNEYDKILILYKDSQEREAVDSKLSIFKKQKCIWLQDITLEENIIKIILEE